MTVKITLLQWLPLIITFIGIAVIAWRYYNWKVTFSDKKFRWFFWFSGVFILLIISYLILHNIYSGKEYISLSDDEITMSQTIVDKIYRSAPDSMISERRDSTVKVIYDYINNNHNIDSSKGKEALKKYLEQYAASDFPQQLLTQIKILVGSYFWLASDRIYLEVIFWSLFGVLCSLFYYVSEAIRKGEYDASHEFIHFAKILYAPLTTLIVYFNLSLLITNGDVNVNNLQYGTIILSFILGFFSGRTIELLDRIKTLLLPYKNDEQSKKNLNTGTGFSSLDKELQLNIIEKAIGENEEKWKQLYNAQTIMASLNSVDGIDLEQPVIKFTVLTKSDSPKKAKQIPEFLEYKDYQIPTDVEQENEAEEQASFLAQPGSKIIREKESLWGSLGLLVTRAGKEYILSCYHVLARTELLNSNFQYKKSVANKVYMIADNVYHEIGKVVEGTFNSRIDAAIAEITTSKSINPEIKELLNNPRNGIRILTNKHVLAKYQLFTYGAASDKVRMGKLKAKSVGKTISIAGKNRVFEKLIPVTIMSKAGDSGAPVVDETGKVVGIIVGGSNTTTYVIPITEIMKEFNVEPQYV